ncbi:uncharacterized protein LOC143143362 isoform X1 [Ptiloglossa arizonensis]|uniref:uncharacterized protein LOC143143362 isoform X1 n=1 Tax=Ptiloglossa arizonensis TaxID=3350558 RepID=UPI003FA01849
MDEKISGFLTQENFNLNETNGTITIEGIEKEHKMNLKKFQVEEFNANNRDINKNNCWKNPKINVQQREDSGRNLKRDSRKFEKNKKKELKKDQSKTFNNDQIKHSNEYHKDELLGNQSKRLKDNLNKKSEEFFKGETERLNVIQSTKLEWLQFTRYKPPKIHRKSTVGKNTRKASLHPRIPFSTFQLDFLEQKFRNSAYLLRNDVLDISVALKLSPKKVKIWFQNRRARQRREFHANIKYQQIFSSINVLSFDQEI